MRKRRKQDKADRPGRDAYLHSSEMVYRQPGPFTVNEYWTEEIEAGPGLPTKRAKKTRANPKAPPSSRGLRPLDRAAKSESKPYGHGYGDVGQVLTNGDKASLPSDLFAVGDMASSQPSKNTLEVPQIPEDRPWSAHHQQQRDDEELWGVNRASFDPAAVSSTGALSTVKTTGRSATRTCTKNSTLNGGTDSSTASTDSFFIPKNPPVNDLHPPVATNPQYRKNGCDWMIQPVPAPSVMSGKGQVSQRNNQSVTVGSLSKGNRPHQQNKLQLNPARVASGSQRAQSEAGPQRNLSLDKNQPRTKEDHKDAPRKLDSSSPTRRTLRRGHDINADNIPLHSGQPSLSPKSNVEPHTAEKVSTDLLIPTALQPGTHHTVLTFSIKNPTPHKPIQRPSWQINRRNTAAILLKYSTARLEESNERTNHDRSRERSGLKDVNPRTWRNKSPQNEDADEAYFSQRDTLLMPEMGRRWSCDI